MILDSGIAVFARVPSEKGTGNIPGTNAVPYLETWYKDRTVGIRRFFEARQAGQRIDTVIRILRPVTAKKVWADDACKLADGKKYKVVQVQELRDEDAGEDVLDISLERVDGLWQ